jgi:hypothetical protein
MTRTRKASSAKQALSEGGIAESLVRLLVRGMIHGPCAFTAAHSPGLVFPALCRPKGYTMAVPQLCLKSNAQDRMQGDVLASPCPPGILPWGFDGSGLVSLLPGLEYSEQFEKSPARIALMLRSTILLAVPF